MELMQRVLIIGATSAIAAEVARIHARRGDALALVARNAEHLAALAAELRTLSRAAPVLTFQLDANDLERHAAVLDEVTRALDGTPNDVLLAHGALGDQRECERSVAATIELLNTNATSVIALCTLLAPRLVARGGGTLAVIGSVAGDRGKPANYVYGAAKAAIDVYLQGLRARLFRSGVRVVTIKPGFVVSPMTARFRKSLLFAQPAPVAAGIVRAMDRGTPVVYLPSWWRWVMLAVRLIPERVFRRLSLQAQELASSPPREADATTRRSPPDA
jgi:short-subunit dehydrogenase